MTNSKPIAGPRPFTLRFGETIPQPPQLDICYDLQRQVAQVWTETEWRDVADCEGRSPWQATLITKVSRETTDDN